MHRADHPRERRRPRPGRLAVAVPTVALLTLAAAGAAHAATPDPGALAIAPLGSGFTLGDATSGGDTTVPTLTPPPAGTLLADTRILTAAPTGKCQFGDGDSVQGVARHSQRAGGDPVAYQTINLDFCWGPTTGFSGGWDGDSAVTDFGKKLGIVPASRPENDVEWVPRAGNRKLTVESESVFSKRGLLGRNYGAGMRVEVSFPPGGSSPQVVCTASFDGDPALARCADNRGDGNQGDGTRKAGDGDRSWWGADLWRKLFGGGH